jgi:hypothetical protein
MTIWTIILPNNALAKFTSKIGFPGHKHNLLEPSYYMNRLGSVICQTLGVENTNLLIHLRLEYSYNFDNTAYSAIWDGSIQM